MLLHGGLAQTQQFDYVKECARKQIFNLQLCHFKVNPCCLEIIKRSKFCICNLSPEVSEPDTSNFASCKVAIVFRRLRDPSLWNRESTALEPAGIPQLFVMWNVESRLRRNVEYASRICDRFSDITVGRLN